MTAASPSTIGVDHVGLAVRDLDASRRFFCEGLGWQVVGGDPGYPAVFVGDGRTVVTLWQVEDPAACTGFDRRKNVGLHHLALRVGSLDGLEALHERVAAWPGVVVEFAPERSGAGPKVHFIVREPSGVRIEFAFDPRV
jgi:catechol 2,3-dioxygenase-like lactoylglutathione lyase family enzyme